MTRTQLAADPRTVAQGVLSRLERAWNEADGTAFGDVYAPDASFVTIRGEHFTGRATIAAGHAGIFSTIYAGSVNRMELIQAHEVADGVVLSISRSTLDCPAGPLAGRHQATSTSVITRCEGDGAAWQVVSTHNSLVTA